MLLLWEFNLIPTEAAWQGEKIIKTTNLPSLKCSEGRKNTSEVVGEVK